jgi:hypothetical protein
MSKNRISAFSISQLSFSSFLMVAVSCFFSFFFSS